MTISTIKQHMYCPMKLYIKTHVDNDENEDYQLAVEIKKLKIDIQDLIQKNMRKIKKGMPIQEIEKILSENIDNYIESTAKSIKSLDLGIETSQITEIIDNAHFNIKITALKIKQAMLILDKNGFAITDMFFPTSMYSYLLKDPQLGLIGMCDKIEIIDGKYYPITLKSSTPPIKGVWDQDAIELVAHAILLEEEFETEVYVGFVEYEKIGDRRPVVMDVNLRKALFEIMREIKEITDNKKLPKVKKSPKKCEKCEYKDICLKE
jgi:CRISPR-associated exonuclease Cas4